MSESLFLNKFLKTASSLTSKLNFARCYVPSAFQGTHTHSQELRRITDGKLKRKIQMKMAWIFRSRIWTFESFRNAGQAAVSPPDLGLNSETPAKMGYVIPRLRLSKHGNHSEPKSAEMSGKAQNKRSSPGELISPPSALEFSVCNHYHLKYYLSCCSLDLVSLPVD